MRLGARWATGEPPHRSVPAALHAEISRLEREYPLTSAWTLTWLEGRPRVQLDDRVILELTADGDVRVSDPSLATDDEYDGDTDDWLTDPAGGA